MSEWVRWLGILEPWVAGEIQWYVVFFRRGAARGADCVVRLRASDYESED